ncbi:RING finger protein 215 [Eucalyptus grandis]|uniref:RING finger protein 215 n=1 Tax=Eucalyptus grandis TaxID=71139 RepID=UPI00192EDC02|nr:RING finger protein 215 [Eucalyptus grandis]
MVAGSVREAARRASLSVSGALLLVAAALASFCCSLELPPPWTILRRRRGGESAPCAAGGVCTVCLGEVSSDGKVRRLAECGHCFHAECIDTWLGYRRTCPLCRTTVSPRRGGWAKLRAAAGWLLRVLMASACKWLDRHFDCNLAMAFCHNP